MGELYNDVTSALSPATAAATEPQTSVEATMDTLPSAVVPPSSEEHPAARAAVRETAAATARGRDQVRIGR